MLWTGTSTTEHCGCRTGPKAKGLILARRLGFSVPPFWEICSCRLRTFAERGEWDKIADMVAIASEVVGLREGDTFAIRSNAWIETGELPGRFFSAVDVQPRVASLALLDFLRRNDCLSTAGRYEGTIIIQRFIKAELAGIASTADAPEGHLLVETVSGSNLALTSGLASPTQITLKIPSGVIAVSQDTHQPQTRNSLPAELKRDLETLGVLNTELGTSFRIEWCWSANRLWLLQTSRIAAPSYIQGLSVDRLRAPTPPLRHRGLL
jgi:hypothetical protein